MSAPHWITPADVAAIWRIPTGTVYWLANENRWRRHTAGRRTSYHADDVAHTMEKRR